jgi:2-amino-4-hydroxy-6-hydroxymethyldihydropteridine diphosphokinase
VAEPQPPAPQAERVVLAFGSNLGDRLAYLQAGLDLLAHSVQIAAVSSIYETDPVGGPAEQDPYLNAIAVGTTRLTPEALLRQCHEAEAAAERIRAERWGPRTLDVDVVAYGSLRRTAPDPVLPHPRAHERAFVLLPWAEVDPGAELPGFGSVAELAAGVDGSGVRIRPGLPLAVTPR